MLGLITQIRELEDFLGLPHTNNYKFVKQYENNINKDTKGTVKNSYNHENRN